MPKRIQRKRTKGWRMPPNTVCVDRSTKWGNHYRLVDVTDDMPSFDYDGQRWWIVVGDGDVHISDACDNKIELIEWAVYNFEVDLKYLLEKEPDCLSPLRGKNLACFCPLDQPCHADVLLELANPEDTNA